MSEYKFDRYVNGKLMVEGCIVHAENDQQAAAKLAKLCCDYPVILVGVNADALAENERLTDLIFQGEGIDAAGELGITRDNFREWLRERDQEKADALAEAGRLREALAEAHEGAARQLAEPRNHADDQYALTAIATTCENGLAATPTTAAWLEERDRRMKLIGAAEELERLAQVNQHRMLDCNDLTERAAQLRREAENA